MNSRLFQASLRDANTSPTLPALKSRSKFSRRYASKTLDQSFL